MLKGNEYAKKSKEINSGMSVAWYTKLCKTAICDTLSQREKHEERWCGR